MAVPKEIYDRLEDLEKEMKEMKEMKEKLQPKKKESK